MTANIDPIILQYLSRMMIKRGYTVPSKDLNVLEESLPFCSIISLNKVVDHDPLLVYILHSDVKLNNKTVIAIYNTTTNLSVKHIIIIYNAKLTSAGSEIIKELNNNKESFLRVELFHYREMKYDPTEHVLVPPHVKLNDEEAKNIRDKYGSKMPKLDESDIIVRYYNFSKGDIIKIIDTDTGVIKYRIIK